jgi:hypothetical protein
MHLRRFVTAAALIGPATMALAQEVHEEVGALPTVKQGLVSGLTTIVIFLMLHLLPGDAAEVLAGADSSPETLAAIRKDLGLFANLRPAVLFPELANASTLKPEVVAGLDIMIVRELTVKFAPT